MPGQDTSESNLMSVLASFRRSSPTDVKMVLDSPILGTTSSGDSTPSSNTGTPEFESSDSHAESFFNIQHSITTHLKGRLRDRAPRAKCALCQEAFSSPKVLSCLHTFCQQCLEKVNDDARDKLACPICGAETALPLTGISGLLSDDGLSNMLESCSIESLEHYCTSCTSRDSYAKARCLHCDHYLCPNCVTAHQYMHCFEGHRVVSLSQLHDPDEMEQQAFDSDGGTRQDKPMQCTRHSDEILSLFCHTCSTPICVECVAHEHPKGLHEHGSLSEAMSQQIAKLKTMMEESHIKAKDLTCVLRAFDQVRHNLERNYSKAQNEVNSTAQFFKSLIDERRQETLKDLETIYQSNTNALNDVQDKMNGAIDKVRRISTFMDRLTKFSTNTEIMMNKQLLETQLKKIMSASVCEDSMENIADLEFASNYQAIQAAVRATFGYIKQSNIVQGSQEQCDLLEMTENVTLPLNKSPLAPIGRPNSGAIGSERSFGSSSAICCSSDLPRSASTSPPTQSVYAFNQNSLNQQISCLSNPMPAHSNIHNSSSFRYNGGGGISSSIFESSNLNKRLSSASSLGPFSTSLDLNPYERWSTSGDSYNSPLVGMGNLMSSANDFTLNPDAASLMNSSVVTSVPLSGNELNTKFAQLPVYPLKSQLKRQKMIYNCKFGEFGVMEGQFTEPSGVAVNAQNDIIVADTNNHRIQIFNREGHFKFQFGECGKRDGQLLYPNRVSVVKTSGDIIVTERSPTHQIQVYNQYGQFVRKFGANILQHPRGITVDNKGRIIVVECKVMRVLIFDQAGNVLQKFGCSKHLEFPNGVVVNDKQEIFISDNRAHCVKVFNYEGVFLRKIGGEGITNYPIGVCINQQGEILVADNHNNFNITIFTQDGQLVNALESKVKHAQCFDVALMDDGSVVLASKDYRLYIYRYIQVPALVL